MNRSHRERLASKLRAHARSGRRGTFIVLVVGMLALMTIVAVVYFSIGQGDARASAALVTSSSRDDVPEEIAEYIANIIARDVTNIVDPGTGSADLTARYVREAWDYPYTNPTALSISGTGLLRFKPDGRFGDDPWLSSTAPTILGTGIIAGVAPAEAWELYKYRRDILHMSNIAPDGNAVNLYNLREHGFDATPAEMREALSLFDAGTLAVPGTLGSTDLDNGEAMVSNVPAHLFNRLRNAHRPAIDTDNEFGDPNYLLSQFCDADGDGWIDSRWQELVDASDPSTDPVYAIDTGDGMRYFVATVIRDLSARIPANIATDLNVGPTFDSPLGMTPADLDLRSVLTLQDAYTLYGESGLGTPVGDGPLALNIPNPDEDASVEHYGDQTADFSRDVGRWGYNALRLAIETSVVPLPRSDLNDFATTYLGAAAGGTTDPGIRTMPTALLREASYIRSGASTSSGSFVSGAGQALSGGFGLPDLVELLTYGYSNDPGQISLMESAVGGRFPNGGSDPNSTRRYSPFRDNRSMSLERPTVTLDDDELLDQVLLSYAIDVRHHLTTLSGARPIRPANTNAALLQDTGTSSAYDFTLDVNDLLDDRNIQRVFQGYADALLPYTSKITGLWNRAGTFNQTKFLSYGYDGPELALRLSAHMAVNFFAAAQQDGDPATTSLEDFEPYPYTVIVNESVRSTLDSEASAPIAGRNFGQAWWNEEPHKLDLAALRPGGGTLATTAGDTQAAAITVFGVKPQPVITQVTSYTFYVDAPTGTTGGDDDGAVPPPGIPPEPIEIPQVTIDGDPTWGNPDYLGRIVAVQLTNPYNVDIYLSGDERSNHDDVIPAGENDFTYYLQLGVNPNTDDRVYRLASVETTGVGAGVDLKAIVLKAGESRNFLILDTDYATMRNRWGLMQARFGDGTADTTILSQWIDKQLSVDQDGSGTTMLEPLVIPEINRLTGVRVVPPASPFNADDTLNRTVRLWRVMTSDIAGDEMSSSGGTNAWQNDFLVDRLRDPGAGPGSTLNQRLNLPSDELPGSRAGTEVTSTPATRPTLNDNTGFTIVLHASIRRPDDAVGGTSGIPAYAIESRSTSRNKAVLNPFSPPTRSDFVDNEDGAYWNFNWFLATTLENGSYVGSSTPILDVIQATAAQHPNRKTGGGIGNNLTNVAYATIAPEFPYALESKYAGGTLRPADMLLPFAVGPWVEMDSTGAATLNDSSSDDWYTMGEALALALDYDRGTSPNVMANLGDMNRNPSGMPFPRRATDGANLVYDDYVLFRDTGGDQQYSYSGTADTLFGTGIPAALTVLDLFHTLGYQVRGERIATPGVINICTAPEEVLRAARILSPSSPWGDDWGGVIGTAHDANSDIAATLVAYRDKIPVYPRRPGNYETTLLVDFSDRNEPAAADDPTTTLDDDGRFYATNIPGLRETPGFRSLGELLLLRDTRPSNAEGQLHSIDRLGTETPPTDLTDSGVDAGFYYAGPDGLTNEYSERLAITNSVANLFTVRSDYYAVWFVLHGYQPSDVTGLDDDEPLVPTVARRFLMIVDRSNVTMQGDEPQIVLFKELPY